MRLRRFLASNPFLCTGVLGTLVFGAWIALGLHPRDGGVGEAVFYLWRVLAAPVHLAANLLAPLTDGWPDVLDGAAVVVVGLLPYALADVLWRRRAERRRGRAAPAP